MNESRRFKIPKIQEYMMLGGKLLRRIGQELEGRGGFDQNGSYVSLKSLNNKS